MHPSLFFLILKMPNFVNGFEMLNAIPEKKCVIFTTAYDQYAIKAISMQRSTIWPVDVEELWQPWPKLSYQYSSYRHAGSASGKMLHP